MSATQIFNESQIVDKEVGKVYYTNDLSLFKLMEGNRTPNPKHISRISKSMKHVGVLMNPIIVNSELEVVDGQHRLLAAKETNLGIYYIIADEYHIKEVHALNVNQKKWALVDFIEGYSNLGKKEYVKLKKFMNKYSILNIGTSIKFACNSDSGNAIHRLKEGRFEFTRDWASACRFVEKLEEICKYYKEANRTTFVRVLIKLYDEKKNEFDLDHFIDKVKKYPHMLYPIAGLDNNLELVEKLYNYRKHEKVNLRY